MSKYRDDFILKRYPSDAIAACRAAMAKIGWRLGAQTEVSLTALQTPQAMSFGNPVTVQISVTDAGNGSTQLALHGSNLGFGPIQSRHVKSQVQLLRQAIEQAAAQPAEPRGKFTRQVIVNDERLSDGILAGLEREYGLRIGDGRYWYDSACGAWGRPGEPAAGFVLAGLNLGGLLRADASNGDTGVFINGRQLHTADVMRLQQLVGQVWPGRWWLDALGNFGMEGSPVVGNLWVVARQRTAPNRGGSHTAPAGGVTVGGEGGFLYAQGRDALGNPFSAWSG